MGELIIGNAEGGNRNRADSPVPGLGINFGGLDNV
jgi:hypothetical protein